MIERHVCVYECMSAQTGDRTVSHKSKRGLDIISWERREVGVEKGRSEWKGLVGLKERYLRFTERVRRYRDFLVVSSVRE